MTLRIGIDVGGTNTDAVLVMGAHIVASTKNPTTRDVTSGIVTALADLRAKSDFAPEEIGAVMIGTTHFLNALVEAHDLTPTAVIRLGLPAAASLPPFTDWPRSIVEACKGQAYMAHGGHEYDGREISLLRPDELRFYAREAVDKGARSIALSSVFSPVNIEGELAAADIIRGEVGPEIPLSLSHRIGRVGLLERENATIINAALRELAERIVSGLSAAVVGEGITAPLYLCQNDGTLISLEDVRQHPVATFSSGPTNSMRGAARLSGHSDCVVVDIGGTTTDVGVLQGGFPREAGQEVTLAGVRTNFRMPDVLSVGIGGGSRVRHNGARVGPDSVGSELRRHALVFGGNVLTATDIAVAAGHADIGSTRAARRLSRSTVDAALERISHEILDVADRMRTSSAPLPLVAVGGGAILLPKRLDGFGGVVRPDHFDVTNAFGAATAQVSGEIDRIYSVRESTRAATRDEARFDAVDRAIASGASPASVEIVEFDEFPIPYLPGNAIRIRVKAVGDLDFGR
ncbi:hydantoinase/oxoprolinase N-terminal domain-containing protein [Streptomyces capillispiralis]|uniref:N-methylhydantoinase A/oxoprolinase/acetone carboxylase beta subunit n=1 Tax=Streptomyces capillispiralis TaxID=68182 RepID=A0A561SGJ5_9ACTN|nr:hydantoinase/oxoprolinase family protein [Streptomyces capillispiralis]TWF73994.1 N-methylhydantoinase A/oxoprolinase/acetone carboxylase beta subunit [Streptomyces capillispiralis]GHH96316.1 hydantoinase [Streptomyces capillispiralis]